MSAAEINRLYANNIGLIHTVARKGYGRLMAIGAGVEYEDVFQEMSIVFIKSAESFDASKGLLSSYFIRVAYFRINKIVEKFELERVEAGVRSTQELSEMAQGEEDDFVSDFLVDHSQNPELSAEVSLKVENLMSRLSPLSKTILEWTVMPPSVIQREIACKNEHAKFARSLGFGIHASPDREKDSFSFACQILERAGVSKTAIKAALSQLESTMRRFRYE